jgi:asparagine synthase (glutamine-hydrolysing)
MCGLVAILQFDGAKPDMAALRRMADRVRHRGPDGSGVFNDGEVAFAHQRLSIIDLATGQQPMTFDGITVAFNGEIYNYIELRDELIRAGHTFRTTSDTEVLLRMYLQYGTDAIARLNGMFAFVLYDSRRDQVVAARDHFGIKPLYLCRMRDRLIYASEIKSILAHPYVEPSVDPVSLHDYVTLQYTLGDGTLFRGIRKVPPGHFEVTSLSSHDTRRVRYWKVSYEQDRTRTEDEFVEELRGLLANAVRQQMRSDVPVGTYLSGGLDSSTVTALAARETNQPLRTFTGAFREGPEFDESGYARMVAEQCGAQMHFVYPTEKQFIDLLPKLAYHMDEPAAGPGLFPQYIVSSLAASHVKVCLGGQGGDEIFGGYARYAIGYFEQALKDSILGNSEEGEDAIPLASLAPNLGSLKQYVPLLKRTLRSGIFDSREQQYFSLVDRSEGTIEAFSPAFRSHYHRDSVFQRFTQVFNEPDTRSYFNRMLHYDMQTGLQSLLHVEDRVSMAVSLESRVPLLDPRIVELVAKIPPPIKFKGGEMKYLFKRAIKGLLPEKVFSRTDKMGFPVPLQIWAKDAAKDFFCDVLLSQRTRERGLYDMDVVEQLIRQESNFSRVLWGLLQLELWHREFLDAGSTRSLGVIHAA